MKKRIRFLPLVAVLLGLFLPLWGCGDISVLTALKEAVQAAIHYPGTLDASFLATGSGPNDMPRHIAVQADNKILIGGQFTTYNGTSRGYIARLNTDGSLDSGFATGAGANDWVFSIAVQSDGKILIGGYFTAYNGASRGRVARLNTDGSLDTGFAVGAGANAGVSSVAVQSDGKIIIGGWFTTYNGTSRGYVARLNTDGSLDSGFATGAGANNFVYSVAVQDDDKVLIGGSFTTYNGTNRAGVARLNTDGSLDTGFATGAGTNQDVLSVVVQSNSKVLIGGWFTTYNSTSRGYFARLNTDGSLDAGFATGAGANGVVYTFAEQSDGRIFIGGAFTSFNGTSQGHLVRLNTDGNLDTGFATGAEANNLVISIVVQSDGKILISGSFTTYDGTSRPGLARLWN